MSNYAEIIEKLVQNYTGNLIFHFDKSTILHLLLIFVIVEEIMITTTIQKAWNNSKISCDWIQKSAASGILLSGRGSRG